MNNINIEENALVTCFEELVSIYSPSRREKAMADFLADKLKAMGADIFLDHSYEAYEGNAPTIFARFPGTVPGPGVSFSAHMDVVEPNRGVKVLRDGDWLHSDGTTTLGGDDKGGICAILTAISYLLDHNIDHEELVLILTPGEEMGMLGAQAIDWKRIRENIDPPKDMIVVDNAGPVCHVAYQAPASYHYRFTVHGKSAHAGIEPEKGVNAIRVLSRILSALPSGRIDARTTANISTLRSDFPSNVVPDLAEASGELRGHDPDHLKELLASYERLARKTAEAAGGRATFTAKMEYPPLCPTDDLRFAKEFQKIYQEVGVDADLQIIGGGSDANFFAEEGFNAIIIGVGMDKVHTVEERLNVKDLHKTTEALVHYLAK